MARCFNVAWWAGWAWGGSGPFTSGGSVFNSWRRRSGQVIALFGPVASSSFYHTWLLPVLPVVYYLFSRHFTRSGSVVAAGLERGANVGEIFDHRPRTITYEEQPGPPLPFASLSTVEILYASRNVVALSPRSLSIWFCSVYGSVLFCGWMQNAVCYHRIVTGGFS